MDATMPVALRQFTDMNVGYDQRAQNFSADPAGVPPMQDGPDSSDDCGRSTIGRAFTLLNAFSSKEPFLTLGGLAERANLPRSTTHRLATVLVKFGALQRRGNLGYTIGSRMFDVGLLAPTRSRLLDSAAPFMHDLHEITRGTVHLASWSGQQVIYLSKIAQPGEFPIPSRLGGAVPLHAAALGKCMLAFSAENVFESLENERLQRYTRHTISRIPLLHREIEGIRSRGLGHDNEESVLGVSCIASPVLNDRRECIAAISVSIPTVRLRERATEQAVQRSADSIARGLVR